MINKKREKQVHRYITTIALLTIVPSIYLTIGMVHKTIYEQRVEQFIQEALVFENSQVIDHSVDYSEHSIRVMLFGEEIDSTRIAEVQGQLAAYRLNGSTLQIVQASDGSKSEAVKALLQKQSHEKEKSAELLAIARNNTQKVELELAAYHEPEEMASKVLPELQVLFPQVQTLSMALGTTVSQSDSTITEEKDYIAIIQTSRPLQKSNLSLIQSWLRQRTSRPGLHVVIEQ